MTSTIIPEMNSTTVDLDDDVVYSASTRNFILRKMFVHMPRGSFKILIRDESKAVAIELAASRTMIFLEEGETWKQIKRLLAKEHGDPNTWECPVCFQNPTPCVLSTCDICLNSTCMKCFIEMFESSCGKINCPFCRDNIGADDLTPEHCAYIARRMREDHCIK
jgi:hypothetical protein